MPVSETDALILQTEELTDEAVAQLQLRMEGYQAKVLKRLEAFVSKFDTVDGKFVPGAKANTLLNTIKRELKGVVEAKALKDASKEFLTRFDEVGDNVRAMHGEENGISVPKSQLTDAKALAIESTQDALLRAGIDGKFIDPVKKALFTHINFGGGVLETEKILRALVLGPDGKNGALTKYIGQVATDAINQYEGAVQAGIAQAHGLTALRYTNSIIATSRPQCVRWVKKEWITEEELAAEIAWAMENGSGMIPETDVTTFLLYRGGYRCRHKAIPVRNEVAKKAQATMPPKPAPEPTGSKEEQTAPSVKKAAKAKKVAKATKDDAAAKAKIETNLQELERQGAEAQRLALVAITELQTQAVQLEKDAVATGKQAASNKVAQDDGVAVLKLDGIEASAAQIGTMMPVFAPYAETGPTFDAAISAALKKVGGLVGYSIPVAVADARKVIADKQAALSAISSLALDAGTTQGQAEAAAMDAQQAKTAPALKKAKDKFSALLQRLKGMATMAKPLATAAVYTVAWEEFNGIDDKVDDITILSADVYAIKLPEKPKAPSKLKVTAGEVDKSKPLDTDKWVQVSGKKGTNPGGVYRDENGEQWYLKEPQTDDHVSNEVLAARLYEAVGVAVADVRTGLRNGKRVVVSKIINGGPSPAEVGGGAVHGVVTGFAADAWLANWDAVGATYDNVLIPWGGGVAVRVDVGGSLRYRAQGSPKGDTFGHEAKEFDTLRDANKNAVSAKAFAGVTPKMAFDKAKEIRAFVDDPGALMELVQTYGPTDKAVASKLIETLQARAYDVYKRAKAWAENPDQFANVGTSEKPYDPLKVRVKAREAAEILQELEPVPAGSLEMFNPKGSNAGLFSSAQAKKLISWIGQAAERSKKKPGALAENAELVNGAPKELKKLNPAEQRSVKVYTGSGSDDINKALYTPNEVVRTRLATENADHIKNLTNVLNKTRLKDATMVSRSISGEWAEHIKALGKKLVGKVIRKPSFTSTSISEEGAFGGSVMFRILLPKGTKAAYVAPISTHDRELEVLLQRGAYLSVVSVDDTLDRTIINCVLVGNGGD